MASARETEKLLSLLDSAHLLAGSADAEAVLLLLEFESDWEAIAKKCGKKPIFIATHLESVFESAGAAGLNVVRMDIPEATVADRLTQAILEAVVMEWIAQGAAVVAVYSSFDTESVDTVSVIQLNERLGKLTARDLRKLETKVPLDTLKLVVDLAVDIGREGREGKPVGTCFVVGDHRKVLEESRPSVFDFVKGYPRRERNLAEPRVREAIKEIAQLDGMFVIASDAVVEACCRIIDTSPVELTLTTGLGSRHFSAAAISKNTASVAITVSESSGTVRLFQNGEVILRIESFRRAMKWKSFQNETPPTVVADKPE